MTFRSERRCARTAHQVAIAATNVPATTRGAGDGVREGRERRGVGQQRPDARQLGAAGLGIEADADWVLHERVGGEDEVRREPGADGGQPDRGQVHLAGQAVPAEDPQAEERRLDEERRQALDSERGAEDVTDEARVLAPVHAELELLHDAGGDADREVDQEQLAEELRQPQPALVVRAHPDRLHDRHERRQADRQRDEHEVVDRDDPELPSGKVQRVHGAPPQCDGGPVRPPLRP